MDGIRLDRRAWLELLGASAAALAAGPLAGCGDGQKLADAATGAPDAGSGVASGGNPDGGSEGCQYANVSPQRGKPSSIGPEEGSPHVAFLTYPGHTNLDLVGPFTAMTALQMHMHTVWKNRRPIETADGIVVLPSTSFEDCPEELDVLCVPGSLNDTATMMRDPEVLEFLRSRKAKYVTSVCTGSLILGAAGLLRGYRATSHWVTLDILSTLEAEPVSERVVIDRNRVTAAGVTAGIELGLRMVELLNSELLAQGTQLVIEYDPEPVYGTGHPRTTADVTVDLVAGVLSPVVRDGGAAAEEAATGFG